MASGFDAALRKAAEGVARKPRQAFLQKKLQAFGEHKEVRRTISPGLPAGEIVRA
ncbi:MULTISPECIES: hypothetical protein [Cupriavidus]|uniref:Uncharacterized protein n=1 Tax=Cupriavidus campinensis TaxID=151783 RepID=A0AAE9HY05_9BURK|nr:MULTISPECIES: hypothetical protein [Cupriavidus]URF03489.1 hypothetical protein M5D45_13280 [Cupriavidus campinensis]